MIGTPYAELDCINLIKKVIRMAPGGVPGYTTAGTNSLWDSYEAAPKYKDLTWRQTSIKNARAGMIAFKLYGLNDVGHAGIVTDDGTVIHASSEYGKTVETKLSEKDGWDLLAVHRYIKTKDKKEEGNNVSDTALFKAEVFVNDVDSYLSLREEPNVKALLLERIPRGAIVEVLESGDAWWRVRYKGETGWASSDYMSRVPDEVSVSEFPGLTIIDGAGRRFYPTGGFTVIIGTEDSID